MNYGDQEDAWRSDEWMASDNDIDEWRWCDHLSVTNASMLAVGLNPSVFEFAEPERPLEGYFHRIGSSNHVTNYFHSQRFVPVFRAITYAALKGELPCDFAHHARTIPTMTVGDRDFDTHPEPGEEGISYDLLIRSDQQVSANFEMPPYGQSRRFYFVKEPDWHLSSLAVDDLKDWMVRRGRKPAFFFPETVDDSEVFRNPAHEHFSAELDFAMTAWQALLPERRFVNGVKAAIEAWIEANPQEWKGEQPMSQSAKDRIATLINWNKSGGAPRTGL